MEPFASAEESASVRPPPPPPPSQAPVAELPAAANGMGHPDEGTATAAPPLLTVISGLPSASHPVPLGETVVGRSSESDLQLKHPEISRRHCRISWDGGTGCTLEDLGSRWGTKVNGGNLAAESRVPLQEGDRLQIGPVLVYFGFGAPPPDLLAAVIAESEHAHAGHASHGSGALGQPAALGSAGVTHAPGHGPQVLYRGREVEVIPLNVTALRLGRTGEVDVTLADPSISRQHATIERTPTGYVVTDLRSRAGSLVNGRRFEKHQLVIGDQLQMGPFYFRFDGQSLERTTGVSGFEIEGRRLSRQVPIKGKPTLILNDVSVKIERGQFVTILGPSGSGKSTLLDTLTGLHDPTAGDILYDRADFRKNYERLRTSLGYVPQDDIVHRELTVTQALHFCAKLRLPAGTPPLEIDKLVTQTISRLALDGEGDPDRDRTNTPIHRLSGGQRKRVSVGVELLGRPSVIYLDEPTSGLDPATEFKLMELLRHLADGGCTVICTTHVMENVFLTDKVYIINGGSLVFSGGAQEARDHFGVSKLTMLFDRLLERKASEWRQLWVQAEHDSRVDLVPTAVPAQEAPSTFRAAQLKPARPSAALPILLARQWAILCADWKNFLILFGQPLIIAVLVGWVTADSALSLFFAYLATLWFGCSNAAQEIVKELPIYRRERMVGLGSHSYLISKFSLMGTLTAVQGVFLYGCLCAATWLMHPLAADAEATALRGVVGSGPWQLGAIVLTAYAAVGIGFAISAIARSTMQAVMIVPLVLIPQILFSGLVVETKDMSQAVYALTSLLPSYSAQTMMDLSQYWKRPYTQDYYVDHPKAADHLKDITRRDLLAHPSHPGMTEQEAKQEARSTLNADVPYSRSDFGTYAAIKLAVWAVLGYVVAWVVLRKKERG